MLATEIDKGGLAGYLVIHNKKTRQHISIASKVSQVKPHVCSNNCSQHFIFYARPVPVVVEPLHVQVLGEINTRGTFQPHGVTVLTDIGTLSKTDARHLLALINDGLARQASKTRAATLDMMDIER